MKKLPIYAGPIIILFYLLLNWLLPSLVQALSAIVIWFVIAYIAYLIYTGAIQSNGNNHRTNSSKL